MHEDLFAILGIDHGATDKAMERAFKKLTRKYHPEVNPGDERVTARYLEICRAYAVLSDKARRAEYNRLGHKEFFKRFPDDTGLPDKLPGDEYLPDEVREGFLGDILGLRRKGDAAVRPTRGQDVYQILSMDFLEAARGVAKSVRFSRMVVCSLCGGKGTAPGVHRESCQHCKGSGIIFQSRGPLTFKRECARCGGRGYRIPKLCRGCRGDGTVKRTEDIPVIIPAGISTGSEIRLGGLGWEDPEGAPPGDLVISVRVEAHPGFVRKGENIFSSATIMVWEAALGANILIPTIDGMESLSIPPGTQSGEQFYLPNKGVPNGKTGKRGDQYVEIKVLIPASTNEESRRAYRRLSELFPDNPRVKQ